MPPSAVTQILLSPAELSYLYAALSNTPPIRPDGRTSTQFRPLIAEQDILPSTNGSARVCFADGAEAIVGVKAQVEKTNIISGADQNEDNEDLVETISDDEDISNLSKVKGESEWIDMSIDIAGYRDDDPLPAFLSSMLIEALSSSGELQSQLYINRRYHWKLFIDVLLLSSPLSYPLPLLSITTYLALLSARLPKLVSEADEDPMFHDDWEASTFLYPRKTKHGRTRPTFTLLVIVVGDNIIFDPSKDELAVASAVVAASIAVSSDKSVFNIVSLRTIDSPSRLTTPGVPSSLNNVLGSSRDDVIAREAINEEGVWSPPRGGLARNKIAQIISQLLNPNGVVKEIVEGLDNITS